MKNILLMPLTLAMMLTPQIGFAREHAHVQGMDTTHKRALDDLRRIMNCRRDSADSCTPLPQKNFYGVSIDTKNSQIYTVEATIQYNNGTNSLRVDRKELPDSKYRAAQLVHYFMPEWKGSAAWTRAAIERAVKLCSVVTRHNGITILIYPFHPVDIPGNFLKLVITRSPSIDSFSYARDECLIRSDNP